MIEPILDLLRQGGWVIMTQIAILSMIAWSVILWEWLRLRERTGPGWHELERAVVSLRAERRFVPVASAQAGAHFLADLLRSDIFQRPIDRRTYEAQFMPWLRSEAATFERSLRLVAVLAAAMPLLGLLGTVLGMIQTFDALTQRGAAQADSLAGGISQALITTEAGLVLSICVILMHGVLRSRVRRYLDRASVMLKKIETAVCDRDFSGPAAPGCWGSD